MKKTMLFVLAAMGCGIGFVYAEEAAKAAPAAAPAAVMSAAAGVKVEKMAVGAAIDNKEISGEAAQFPGSTARVYCWTKVTADQVPATIKHVWSADGKKEAEVSLNVKYPASRTWSSKNVWLGSWKVDAVDEQGTVLSSKEFTVAKEPAPPAQVGQ